MKNKKAFTLIEMVIVLAVLGLLASFGWPAYLDQARANKRSDAIIATNAVAMALTQYQSDNGIFVWNNTSASSNPTHLRYSPLANVGNNNTNAAQNNICVQERGFRYSTANSRYESCRGYYAIVVTITNTGASFSIATTPISGSDLAANDTSCPKFTLTDTGTKGVGLGSSVKRCWGSS